MKGQNKSADNIEIRSFCYANLNFTSTLVVASREINAFSMSASFAFSLSHAAPGLTSSKIRWRLKQRTKTSRDVDIMLVTQ